MSTTSTARRRRKMAKIDKRYAKFGRRTREFKGDRKIVKKK